MTSTSGGDDESDRIYWFHAEMDQHRRHYGAYATRKLMEYHKLCTHSVLVTSTHRVWIKKRTRRTVYSIPVVRTYEVINIEIFPREP